MMPYQTTRIDNMNHLNIEDIIKEVEMAVSGDVLTIKRIVNNEKIRVRVKHVKCVFECAWHAIKAFEDGEELYTKRSHKDFVLIDNAPDVLRFLYDLHRKVEIEIDERQEFIDSAIELLNQNSHDNEANHYKEWFGAMFDSGKFKLVE